MSTRALQIAADIDTPSSGGCLGALPRRWRVVVAGMGTAGCRNDHRDVCDRDSLLGAIAKGEPPMRNSRLSVSRHAQRLFPSDAVRNASAANGKGCERESDTDDAAALRKCT
jgi:hypothetical protein